MPGQGPDIVLGAADMIAGFVVAGLHQRRQNDDCRILHFLNLAVRFSTSISRSFVQVLQEILGRLQGCLGREVLAHQSVRRQNEQVHDVIGPVTERPQVFAEFDLHGRLEHQENHNSQRRRIGIGRPE